MTRNFPSEKEKNFHRLLAEKRKLKMEKDVLEAFCLFLIVAVGMLLVLI